MEKDVILAETVEYVLSQVRDVTAGCSGREDLALDLCEELRAYWDSLSSGRTWPRCWRPAVFVRFSPRGPRCRE